MTNFIEVYENAMPSDMCSKIIEHFEVLRSLNLVQSRQQQERVLKTLKTSDNILMSEAVAHTSQESIASNLYAPLIDIINACVSEYISKYDVLNPPAAGTMGVYDAKLQFTDVGGGYHMWHFESSDRRSSKRVLFYIAYLNDVEEGGETEFLYVPKRVKPKTGTVVVAPCAFTHTHRGNPPLSNAKYIITGWVEF